MLGSAREMPSCLIFLQLRFATMRSSVAMVLLAAASVGADQEIMIEDFSRSPTHSWEVMNDPVMGGRSSSSYAVEDGAAKFTGTCAIVPFLKAPGFVTMQTGGFRQPSEDFPDVSSCTALKMVMKSGTDYAGYRVSFGTKRAGMFGRGFKAPALSVPSDFDEVVVPFTDFSLRWDEATGDIKTPCANDESACPDADTLRDMGAFAFWGEGVEGDVDLEIRSISAIGCDSGASKSEAVDASE